MTDKKSVGGWDTYDTGEKVASVIVFLVFVAILGGLVSIYLAIAGTPNPAWTEVVERGWGSRVWRSTVEAPESWLTGEIQTCVSPNAETPYVVLTCGGGRRRLMDVRFYGLVHTPHTSGGTQSGRAWQCKRLSSDDEPIECRQMIDPPNSFTALDKRYTWAFARNLDNSFHPDEACRESLAESLYFPASELGLASPAPSRQDRSMATRIFLYNGGQAYWIYGFHSQGECDVALKEMRK